MTNPLVQNTVLDPSNKPVRNQPVYIKLVGASTFVGSTIEIIESVTVTTNNVGLWSVALQPNSTVAQAGTYYEATEPGGATWTFVVPTGAGPFWLHDLLVVGPNSPEAVLGVVRFDESQTLSSGQQSQALANIGGAPGAAAAKLDGAGVKNLRRQTLVIDKMWPNQRTDHMIVWVNETTKTAYAITQANALVKSTWTTLGDEAMRWGNPLSAAATGFKWCYQGGVFMVTSAGSLLWEEVQTSTGQTTLRRSTNGGTSSTVVWTAPSATKYFLGPQVLVQDPNTGYLYLSEYTYTAADTTVSIWRSTDDGVTWTAWVTMPRGDTTGTIRHFHGMRYDSVSQRVYVFTGDANDIAGIYRVTADGTGIESVLLNNQTNSIFGSTNPTSARCVDAMFFPNHIVWACDGGADLINQRGTYTATGHPGIYQMARTEIGKPNPVVTRIADIDNTGWYAWKAADDASAWICCSSTELGTPYNPDPGIAHLYAVTQEGAQVDEVAAFEMDTTATAAISGLCGPSGDGSQFWFRAAFWMRQPFRNFSAFQARARLANGIVPIKVPPARRLTTVRHSASSGPISITASTTVTFGHYRVPRQKTTLYLFDYGAKVLAGTAGTAQVQIWNVTTSTQIAAWAGQAWIYDASEDDNEYASTTACSSGDNIEFRIANTGTGTITASAFVDFGFEYSF